MPTKRLTPQRYQMKKEAIQVALTGHPWIFRSHLSSAAEVFTSGQWLKLVDSSNEIAGYGIYDSDALIAVRMLKLGKTPPDREWVEKTIDKALAKRKNVRGYTDAFRAIHGENDGLPGIVVDVYRDTAVLQTYAPSVDVLGRYVLAWVGKKLGLKNLLWKMPTKRKVQSHSREVRALRGHVPRLIQFREGKMTFALDVAEGQKTGTFLDLRSLRKWLSLQKLEGKRVLNLFSYSGMLGAAAEVGGAKEIWNVDVSKGALDFAKKHHSQDKKRFQWVVTDIFEWLEKLPREEKFDLIIVDPPALAANSTQVFNALRAYRQLLSFAVPHLKEKGTLVMCCCTSRIPRQRFQEEIDKGLGARLRLATSLNPEDDHPVSFTEGDYLKILVYR